VDRKESKWAAIIRTYPDGSTTFRGQTHHVYRCEFCKNKLITPTTLAGRRQVAAIHAKTDSKDAATAAKQEDGCLPVLVMVFVVLAAIVSIAEFG
jgi:hypothetical protein